jgi:hypothetical protein
MENSKQETLKPVVPKSFYLTSALVMLAIWLVIGFLAMMLQNAKIDQTKKETVWLAEMVSDSVRYYEKHVGPLTFSSDGKLKTDNGSDFTFQTFVDTGVLTHLPTLRMLESAYILENASDFLPEGDKAKGWILASATGSNALFSRYECYRYLKDMKDPARSGCGFNAKKQHYAYWQRL